MVQLTVRLAHRIQELEQTRAALVLRMSTDLRGIDAALARLRALQNAMPAGLEDAVATLRDAGLLGDRGSE